MKQLIHGQRASFASWMHSAINFFSSFRASIFNRRTLTMNQLLNIILPNNEKRNAFLHQGVTGCGFRKLFCCVPNFWDQTHERFLLITSIQFIYSHCLLYLQFSFHLKKKSCQKTLAYSILHQHLHPDVTGAITRVSIGCNLNKEFDTVKTLIQRTFFYLRESLK